MCIVVQGLVATMQIGFCIELNVTIGKDVHCLYEVTILVYENV